MRVIVMAHTNYPMQVISRAAGTSYGKDDFKDARVRECFRRGHLSVMEHASATFRIEGISRACSHQLVRHRLASFVQLSQRYTRVDTESDDWYVIPPSFDDPQWFENVMRHCANEYLDAIWNEGIKPEDARYLLPEATKTDLTCTMNVRELFHFLDLRQDGAAQWEIRELANAIEAACSGINDDWRELMGLRQG